MPEWEDKHADRERERGRERERERDDQICYTKYGIMAAAPSICLAIPTLMNLLKRVPWSHGYRTLVSLLLY